MGLRGCAPRVRPQLPGAWRRRFGFPLWAEWPEPTLHHAFCDGLIAGQRKHGTTREHCVRGSRYCCDLWLRGHFFLAIGEGKPSLSKARI